MRRAVRIAVVLSLGLALATAAIVYRDTRSLVGTPYAGFLVLPSAAIAPLPVAPDLQLLRTHGLGTRDRIESVDGAPVATGMEVSERLRGKSAGQPVLYGVARPGGERFEVTVPAQLFGRELIGRLVLPLLAGGLLTIAAGAIGVLARPDLAAARLLFLFCFTSAMNFFIAGPDFVLTRRFVPWGLAACASLSKATLLHLGLSFPQRRGPLRGRFGAASLAAVYGLLIAQSALYGLALGRAPALVEQMDTVSYATYAIGYAAVAANILATAWRAPEERMRQQARVALAGPMVCLAAFAVISLLSWTRSSIHLPILFGTSVIAAFAISLTYAMLRHNLFEFDAVLRRGLAAGAVLAGGGLVYLALFALLGRLLGEPAAWVSVALAVGAVAVGVPVFQPLGQRVERGVAALLFRETRTAQDAVAEAGPRLAALRDAEAVTACVRELAERGLHAGSVHVLLAAVPAAGDEAVAPLAPALLEACRAGDAIHLDDEDAPADSALHAALAALGARVLAPFPRAGEDDPLGGVACGPRADGRLYTREDVLHLEALAAQAAVALANVAAFERVRALQERLAEENAMLRAEIELQHGFDEIVGSASGLRRALAQVEQVAPSDVTVLVTGETGTGKELIVRALHQLSPRRERELVKVACAAIPETLLESELFGHERGAFTGAERTRAGRFEAADGGTIFFDDVDALPLGVQAKLLRALQEGEVQRLGSGELRHVDVRVIAATNRELLDEVRAGRFREDLYYRLHVVPIELPPLRERREDLRALAEHFVLAESRKLGREPHALSKAALAELEAYRWPGNVRELRNVIERAVVLHREGEIELPEPLAAGGTQGADGDEAGADASLEQQVHDFKVSAIRAALAASDGNQRIAAERLGLHRQSLTRMIRDLGLREGA